MSIFWQFFVPFGLILLIWTILTLALLLRAHPQRRTEVVTFPTSKSTPLGVYTNTWRPQIHNWQKRKR